MGLSAKRRALGVARAIVLGGAALGSAVTLSAACGSNQKPSEKTSYDRLLRDPPDAGPEQPPPDTGVAQGEDDEIEIEEENWIPGPRRPPVQKRRSA